jgi:hypothetical protein
VETGHASSGSLMAGFHGFLLLGFLVELNTAINKFKFVIARNRKPKNAVKTIFVKTKSNQPDPTGVRFFGPAQSCHAVQRLR